MITRNICNVDAATLREKSFISPGQQMVSRTVGNDQDYEQGKRRCNQLLAARTHFSKKGFNQRKKPGMFFNEIDEGSPWIRGAPQQGFSRHILRISSRTSREMIGRPGLPCRTFQVQNRRKPARCQATTVSGLIMASAERQSRQKRDRKIHNRRSAEDHFGRFLADL